MLQMMNQFIMGGEPHFRLFLTAKIVRNKSHIVHSNYNVEKNT